MLPCPEFSTLSRRAEWAGRVGLTSRLQGGFGHRHDSRREGAAVTSRHPYGCGASGGVFPQDRDESVALNHVSLPSVIPRIHQDV